jgi:hypothetical protein
MAQEFPFSTLLSGPASIQSESRNVSSGGMCLLLDRACTLSSLLRCEIFLTGSSASIPTLGRVQWIQSHERGKFVAGVEFLL